MQAKYGDSTDYPMRRSSDPEKSLGAEKADVPSCYSGKRKRALAFALLVIVLFVGALMLDVAAVYFVVELAGLAINRVWQVITSLGFFLFKVYSELVTPEQWPGK